jgi:long-subunit acyl-CoA synthetase (AMP-forming)/GNAT superfamily N-acetyltransferase
VPDDRTQGSSSGLPSDDTALERPLLDLTELSPSESARSIEELLRSTDATALVQLEGELLHRLNDRHGGDELLGELDLDQLEALAHRLVDRARGDAANARAQAWQMLDAVRRPTLLRRIADAQATETWSKLVLELVETSQFTFARLFEQRCASYGSRPLFIMPGENGSEALSWHQVAGRVDLIARGLLAVCAGLDAPRVAILSENRLDLALVDLACLATGIVNVMIPANATEKDVAYILNHAEASVVFVSTRDQFHKVRSAGDSADAARRVIAFEADAAAERGVISFDELLSRAGETPRETLDELRSRIEIDDLATVMYTSGTTGTPKGICFSHRNIVFKRFARALALPEIGEEDRFLCFLPLYHTFGRFLEMAGCVFWGSTYCFAGSPAIESLMRLMGSYRPTVFISIPMKWMQLYDAIRQRIDTEVAGDDEITAVVHSVTGGELRWGLSAAGYLDPEVFRFFQRYEIELMSGFGMTEATGGITMTPPGGYREDSLGVALPGIEVALAEDGELLVRGPYVMMGYLDPPDGEPSFDPEGWLHTGDLMERDSDGYHRIIDRKKEIYKNIKGQTIAPQKIENLFRDFESVGQIFLVGDHREYNTALIFPNPEVTELDLAQLSSEEVKAHIRSLVVSANSFLAPYERIVDFAVIDRAFDADHGELTPKGSYRRKNIERNFTDSIRLLYRRTTVKLGGAEITVPNWLFQALGITSQELRVSNDRLELPSLGTGLTIRRLSDHQVQVGAARYASDSKQLDLGILLATPRLWLGNEELHDFAPLNQAQRDRRRARAAGVEWLGRVEPFVARPPELERAESDLRSREIDMDGLHRAALLIGSQSSDEALLGVQLLEHALAVDEAPLAEQALLVLRRATDSSSPDVLRRAFQVLAVSEQPALYRSTLARILDRGPAVLDAESLAVLAERDLVGEQIDAFVEEAETRCLHHPDRTESLSARLLVDFLAEYGITHPSRVRQLRAFLTRIATVAPDQAIRSSAVDARRRLEQGFRSWIGPPSRIAVDPETGREYRWEDVVAFSDEVDDDARGRLLDAIRRTPMLREGVFLFSRGAVVRLEDILPQGVWIRLLGTDHGKSVFRIAVKTRQQEQHDLAVNLNRSLSAEEIQEEIDWLIVCSETRELGPLVEDFGGYWPEHGLWTEEFIPGDTLDRALRRLARRERDEERLKTIWPFAAWSALSAYVDFWNRSGRRLVIADPTPSNVIAPMHDYHTGARLVSISSREPFESLASMLSSFRRQLVDAIEEEHPQLQGLVSWDIVFSAVLEIVGETEGIGMLCELLDEGGTQLDESARQALPVFLEAVERRGFLPKRLFFAAKRLRRWQRLNPDATHFAQTSTLHEMYRTYRLQELQAQYPELRPSFFRETVFRDVPTPLAAGLDEIIDALRSGDLKPDGLSTAVADLRARLTLGDEDDDFLAHLSYPYLGPDDEAAYVATEAGGSQQSEMVVTVMDRDGQPYHLRHALSPKEVARLHRLFVSASLPVQFRPEHRFLVAINDRGSLLGGLFYELQPEEHTAHMDKVVVAEAFQGLGIAGGLIEDLCNRLRTDGYRSLTTGFFRPQFFYRYGFTVERRYAGLVRSLEETDAASG